MSVEYWKKTVRAGQAVIALDTNAVRGRSPNVVGKLLKLAQRVDRLHSVAGLENMVKIPALVHFEMVHQLSRIYGPRFDYQKIISSLQNMNVEILSFDESAAKNSGCELAAWFPDEKAWENAKKSSNGRTALDWAIAAQAQADNWILISDDKNGGEFDRVRKKGCCISFDDASNFLASLCAEYGMPD